MFTCFQSQIILQLTIDITFRAYMYTREIQSAHSNDFFSYTYQAWIRNNVASRDMFLHVSHSRFDIVVIECKLHTR